jgi:hypothetical protein
MANIDHERIERLRKQYGHVSRPRTTSVRTTAAGFKARTGDLTTEATTARRKQLEAAVDGNAVREIHAKALGRKV